MSNTIDWCRATYVGPGPDHGTKAWIGTDKNGAVWTTPVFTSNSIVHATNPYFWEKISSPIHPVDAYTMANAIAASPVEEHFNKRGGPDWVNCKFCGTVMSCYSPNQRRQAVADFHHEKTCPVLIARKYV
jgi:hypothetical protein